MNKKINEIVDNLESALTSSDDDATKFLEELEVYVPIMTDVEGNKIITTTFKGYEEDFPIIPIYLEAEEINEETKEDEKRKEVKTSILSILILISEITDVKGFVLMDRDNKELKHFIVK